MTITLEIPASVADAIRLPRPRLRRELLAELAVALYADEALAFGKARELSGLSHREFAQLLGGRGIPSHYDDTELARDTAYARGQ